MRRLLAVTLLFGAPFAVTALAWGRIARPAHDFAELLLYFIVTRTIAAYLLGFVLLTLPQQLMAMTSVVSVRSDR